ncbi:MAG: zinc ribbon domain-containing protein [bacterium]|nr:zinc ribbon domain-containing protein [bacterium]
MSFDNACPGAKRILEPSPEEFHCRKCGTKVEIWSDEMTAACPQCKSTVSRVKEANCLDWCASAEQCLGVMKYNKLVRSGMITPGEPPGKDAPCDSESEARKHSS